MTVPCLFTRRCARSVEIEKKKFTADAAKSVLLTVHAHPPPEVFLRSIGKWGGSFAEVYFIYLILGPKRF